MVNRILILTSKELADKLPENNYSALVKISDLEPLDRDKLSDDFIRFIGDLNARYYRSLFWWATSISSKNQFVSPLYKNIYVMLQIINLIEKSDQEEIFLLIENKWLIKQISAYCQLRYIKTKIIESRLRKMGVSFYAFAKTFIDLGSFFASNWIKKYLVSRNLNHLIKKNIDKNNFYYVLRTWVEKRSFDKNDVYSFDPFFGVLPNYLRKNENLIILGHILGDFKTNLKMVKNNFYMGTTIIPSDYFLKYSDCIRILLQLSREKFYLPKEIKFRDVDVSYLIQGEIQSNIYGGENLNNLVYYYVAKNLTKRIKCKTFIYPFENHSWEKLTILAIKKYSHDTSIFGYQHSSIPKMLFNYFLSMDEYKISPIPDKIITVGKKPKTILEKNGNFPQGILKEGCALRYEYLFKKNIKKRTKNKIILAGFSGGLEDSTNLLNFLVESLDTKISSTVLLKSHPDVPIEKVISQSRIHLPSNFKIIGVTSTEDVLDKVDIFIYAGTAMCMEALMMGIPVIYVDANKFYNSDPLFECNHLKWTAKNQKDLIEIINKIYDMDDKNFEREQKQAKEYMKDYFSPVNDKGLKEFIER